MHKVGGWGRVCRSAMALLGGLSLVGALHAEPGADNPEVARFPGASIQNYDYKEYEEFQLILAKPQRAPAGGYTAAKLLPLEGKVTYIHYAVPDAASPLQVFRNYQSSLKRSGFADLFTCDRPCTTENLGVFKELMKTRQYLNYSNDNQYLAAQRNNTYVSLWVNDGGVWLFVVEKQKLNDGLMGVTGESPMAKALSTDGKVDVYGFQFDTGKAVLRDGSKPTLQELGQVLQDNPGLQIEVVGHTDDVGAPDANQKLSQARAVAVATALTADYGIAPNRLRTRGMGPTAPLVPNTDDASRAKNRRVEIIAVQAPPTPLAQQPATVVNAKASTTATSGAATTSTDPGTSTDASKASVMDQASKLMDTARKFKDFFKY